MVAPSKELSPWGKAIAGSAAAIIANTIVYPLDIVKTKLQVQDDDQEYTGTIDALKKIYKKEGYNGLYRGLGGSLLGVASTNFAYFYWYGLIRGLATKRWGRTGISTPTELAIGALAGALAQVFTIPVSVVTTKQQTDKEQMGLIETAQKLVKQYGLSSLWTGLKASLVLVVNPSITYGSFERLKSGLFPGKKVLSPYENFLIGALSKIMATIVTQPLIVAKVMQQSGQQLYSSFVAVLVHLLKTKGPKGLYKGMGPQISKGVFVQGLLFMFKDQVELLIVLLFRMVMKSRVKLL